MMDINTLRGLASVFVMIAFIGVCWWAFRPKHRKKFDEAANLPFADEPPADAGRDENQSASATDQHKRD